jgi:hypothetical protein
MRGNGKVFISHTHEDNERCAPLLAALDAWGVDYWFDTRRVAPGDDLSQQIQRAIAERDIFLRICTPAAQRSYWMKLETGAFRGLQARDHRAGDDTTRVLINLILDPGYRPEPFDYAHIFLDATSRPQRAWFEELRRAVGLAAAATPSALPASASAGPATHTVGPDGLADFPTITAALLVANEGDTLLIRPGRYAEELTVEKALTLRGQGERDAIVIEGTRGTALRVTADATVENLTLRQLGGKNLDCVAIARGLVELLGCDISAQTGGACVNLTSAADALLRGNVIHDGNGWGVFAGGVGVVTLEENEICGHTYSGVTVMGGGYVVARRNHIGRNMQHAVRINAGGGGTFEDNDLRGNYLSTWNIDRSSYGKVLRERNKG